MVPSPSASVNRRCKIHTRLKSVKKKKGIKRMIKKLKRDGERRSEVLKAPFHRKKKNLQPEEREELYDKIRRRPLWKRKIINFGNSASNLWGKKVEGPQLEFGQSSWKSPLFFHLLFPFSFHHEQIRSEDDRFEIFFILFESNLRVRLPVGPPFSV